MNMRGCERERKQTVCAPTPTSFHRFPVLGTVPLLHFEVHSVDSLNNRFRPILPIEPEAVFR